MLVIRSNQLAELQRARDKDLLPEVRSYLERHHNQKVSKFNETDLNELCLSAINTSRSYGLTDLVSLIWFAAMSVEIGPQFHEHHRIHEGLQDKDIVDFDRIRATLERTTDEDWEGAKQIGLSSTQNNPSTV